MFILAFMVLVIGGSLLLFAARGHKVRSRVNNALWSRESLLLANNVLLVAASAGGVAGGAAAVGA
ncbi:cytochrome c-type biogenesis CcmF C-terminal domain-containing protein [Escherichia coli]